MQRIHFLRIYLAILAIFGLFWWVLSHWFYPGWYHDLLGFESYVDSFVKIIGTLSIMPILGLFFTAANPIRNRDLFVCLLLLCVLMATTYVFLINTQGFPWQEYLNAAFLLGNAIILSLLYPWRQARTMIPVEEDIR
jgi:hypothetical protein